jgi:HD superfamily phosphohydrolase
MMNSRRIRDPIHGFISLNDRECQIVDTPLFQRLRSIRQLAMASLVYPGALHTRFDHTLGVFSVAQRLCQSLHVDEDMTPLIRFAALLHDLGHGPFSHVSESILDSLSPPALGEAAGKKDKIHEVITQKIIREHPDLRSLSDPEREKIANLLKSGLDHRLHREIVSGPLDADKQDYLLRDSHFCGVSYGLYDLAQLHETLSVGEEDGEKVMMVDQNGVHALEQFVLAKYYLTTQVYRHKVRLITDTMLTRAIELGVRQDQIGFLRDLYTYSDTPEYLKNYLSWDDRRLTVALLDPSHQDTLAGQFFQRLANRRLLKRVAAMPLGPLLESCRVSDFSERFPSIRPELEKALAEELVSRGHKDVSPEFVIVHYYRIDSVRAQSRNSERAIRVRQDGGIQSFEEVSTLFKSIDQRLNEEQIEAYAPVAFQEDKAKRAALEHFKGFLTEFLQRKLSAQQELPLKAEQP